MSKLSANLLLLLAAASWGFGNVPQKAVLEQLDSIAQQFTSASRAAVIVCAESVFGPAPSVPR